MAHGKETPRQKMIGMMYLVLTALLALNVSAEILNAFVLIDESLRKSYTNIAQKNEAIYANFDAQYSKPETKKKVEKWKLIADTVAQQSNKVFQMIDSLKEQIITVAEGPESEYLAEEDDLMKPHHVKMKDENNIPGQIMILEKGAAKLEKAIDSYSIYLQNMIKWSAPKQFKDKDGNLQKAYQDIVSNIEKTLKTDSVQGEDSKVDWIHGNFDQLPLSGVLTMLTKLQSDIRNAEADALNHLFSQIEATAFKFNKLEAIVKPKSSYVLKGNTYEAEIFIAASDSTTDPDIYVGSQKLSPKGGKGVYKVSAAAVGPKVFTGRIDYKMPNGSIKPYPFRGEYEVGAPSLVVAPTKMNVFYIGVDNPVEVSVSGVPDNKVFPFANGYGASIHKGNQGYIVKVKTPTPRNKFCYVGAQAEVDGAKKNMGQMPFRVKRVPDPVAKVADKKGGIISKAELLAQSGVKAVMENFDFDLPVKITKFSVSATIGQYTEDEPANNARFTSRQKSLMQKVRTGSKVYIENIEAVVAGDRRELGTISFKLQ